MLESLHNKSISLVFIDDEQSILDAYKFMAMSIGFEDIVLESDPFKALETVRETQNAIVFLDLKMPKKSGVDVLTEIRNELPYTPVIICSAHSDHESVVKCMQQGAHDYIVKPISAERFEAVLRTSTEILVLRNEVAALKYIAKSPNKEEGFEDWVTRSPAMFSIMNYIKMIAGNNNSALILGETGTGKELVANSIHSLSNRKGKFIPINVSGLDDTVFSDTLFGHVKGAFTGADTNRKGLIEEAENGTLFLDEIGDLDESAQVKLLRLLQENEYLPLGADKPKKCNARIIAAANINLAKLLEGAMRKDLYYRLSTHLIQLPPLNDRKEDLPLLIDYFIKKANADLNKNITGISKEALKMLTDYNFSGNIRELRAYIYDAVTVCTGDIIDENILSIRLSIESKEKRNEHCVDSVFGHFPTLKEAAGHLIHEALQRCKNNQAQAARLLGITRQSLNERLKRM